MIYPHEAVRISEANLFEQETDIKRVTFCGKSKFLAFVEVANGHSSSGTVYLLLTFRQEAKYYSFDTALKLLEKYELKTCSFELSDENLYA